MPQTQLHLDHLKHSMGYVRHCWLSEIFNTPYIYISTISVGGQMSMTRAGDVGSPWLLSWAQDRRWNFIKTLMAASMPMLPHHRLGLLRRDICCKHIILSNRYRGGRLNALFHKYLGYCQKWHVCFQYTEYQQMITLSHCLHDANKLDYLGTLFILEQCKPGQGENKCFSTVPGLLRPKNTLRRNAFWGWPELFSWAEGVIILPV